MVSACQLNGERRDLVAPYGPRYTRVNQAGQRLSKEVRGDRLGLVVKVRALVGQDDRAKYKAGMTGTMDGKHHWNEHKPRRLCDGGREAEEVRAIAGTSPWLMDIAAAHTLGGCNGRMTAA